MSSEPELYEDMEHRQVIDFDGQDLGRIFDFILDPDFSLKYFVSRKGKDVFFIKPEQILEVEGKVRLKVPKKYVRTLEKEEPQGLSFTTLRTKQVFDAQGENVGQILDVIFHKDRKVSFIIGGGGLRSYLSKLGFSSERMLVPHRMVKTISPYNIELHTSKDDLQHLFHNRPLDTKTYLSLEAKQKSSEEIEIQFHRDSFIQVTQNK
ncbi:MAG: PRC-barrel domain containing protein [Methanobacteriota archaeon]|nr:MAG: PRC-barrel domain containing protein [Euryarchaeota archaeon]